MDNKDLLLFKLPSNTNITKNALEPQYSVNLDFPNFELGFQHYLHQSRTKMYDFFDKLDQKVYNIINPFAVSTPGADVSLNSILQVDKDHANNDYYKLWEMLTLIEKPPKSVCVLYKNNPKQITNTSNTNFLLNAVND